MSNTTFMLKKIVKSKLFWISILIITLITLTCLAFNLRNRNDLTLASNSAKQATFDTQQIKQSAPDKSKRNQDNIKLTLADRKTNNHIRKLATDKKWQAAYQAQIRYNHSQLQAENNGKVIDQSLVNFLMSEIYRCQYLFKLNLPEQSRTSPTTGISFSIFIDQIISSVLIPLLLIFNFGLLYTKRFSHNIDKDRLLPISVSSNTSQNLLAGYVIGILLIIITIIVSFATASLISGTGSWHYPIAYFTPRLPFNIYISQGKLIMPDLTLRILSTCFIVTFIYLIATLVKQVLPTILICILTLMGTNLITPYFRPLTKFGQILPTSYFNGINVISGQLAHETKNIQFNYSHGITVLITWTFIAAVATWSIQKMRQYYSDQTILK